MSCNSTQILPLKMPEYYKNVILSFPLLFHLSLTNLHHTHRNPKPNPSPMATDPRQQLPTPRRTPPKPNNPNPGPQPTTTAPRPPIHSNNPCQRPHPRQPTPTSMAQNQTNQKNNVVNSNTRANQPKNNVIKQIDKEGLVVFRK